MHCLNPKEIINPHWSPHRSEGRANLRAFRVLHHDPQKYPEDYKIIIPCGNCVGCLRDYARAWRVRLLHEHQYGNHSNCLCLTLTINPENYEKFQSKEDMRRCLRMFFDRLRFYIRRRRVPKHFFVSELGEKKGRLHFHGFLWDCSVNLFDLRRAWSYGFIWVDQLRSDKQLAYCTKYITKPAVAWHKPTVFVSPKLGEAYTHDLQWTAWHHQGNCDSNINLCCRFGDYVYALPAYYKNKIFTPAELSRFKVLLSELDRPFRKILGRTAYTDPLSFARAREALLVDSVRQGRSKIVVPKPASNFFNAYENPDLAYEFNHDLTPF